jgi:hypothetical protein
MVNRLSAADGHRPLLADVAQRQKEQLEQRLVTGKRSPVLGDLSQAHVDRLNGIGRVDHLADLWRVVKERYQPIPVAPPALTDR